MSTGRALAQWAVLLAFAPLLLGIVARTKARVAGRRGPPLLQRYRDLAKLLRKDVVLSRTSSAVFLAGPVAALVAPLAASLLVPFGAAAPLAFPGDLVLYAALFALGRSAAIAAALDTGSSFEGMGAAREATLAALAEPALFLALLSLVPLRESASLGGLVHPGLASASGAAPWPSAAAPLALSCVALFIVLLAENGRMPFDDPTTHLELTMIHEVMLLDHSGPLLGAAQLGAALKLMVQGALLVRIALPLPQQSAPLAWGALLAALAALAVGIGLVEATLARLRLSQLPLLLLGASLLASLGLVLAVR